MDVSLYDMHLEPGEDYGVHLGAIAASGERGLLVVSMDSLVQTNSARSESQSKEECPCSPKP
jgi:hypothetical protein